MTELKYFKVKFFSKDDDHDYLARLGLWAPDEKQLEALFKFSDQVDIYDIIYQENHFIANSRFQGFCMFDADENVVCIFSDEGTLLTFSQTYRLQSSDLTFLKANKPTDIPLAHLFNRLLAKIQNG